MGGSELSLYHKENEMNKRQADSLVFITAYAEAQKRGREAAAKCVPTPMVVRQHADPLDDNSPVVKQWYAPQGVCGFAWVSIKPGTCAFARWLKANGYAESDDYYGGVSIWIGDYGQSYEMKDAHARAMAEYLRGVGIKAHTMSRLD